MKNVKETSPLQKMKISTLLICGIALFGRLCFAQEVPDPFAEDSTEPLPKPVIPERGVLNLPQSVTHKRIDNSHHEYRIVGLYPLAKGENPADKASFYDSTFGHLLPEAAEVKAELIDGGLVIRTSLEIPYDTLAFGIDWVALGGGLAPTWVELEARDLKKSKLFDRNHYQVTKLDNDFPAGLAWLTTSRTKERRIPFVTKFGYTGTLLVGPTTGRCMCHSKFAFRILHENGRVIWEDFDSAYGDIEIALADTDGDRIHEVYIDAKDHGKSARYVLKHISELPAAEQPANRSDLDSGGRDKPQPQAEGRSR